MQHRLMWSKTSTHLPINSGAFTQDQTRHCTKLDLWVRLAGGGSGHPFRSASIPMRALIACHQTPASIPCPFHHRQLKGLAVLDCSDSKAKSELLHRFLYGLPFLLFWNILVHFLANVLRPFCPGGTTNCFIFQPFCLGY
jgi:hypothetical protein